MKVSHQEERQIRKEGREEKGREKTGQMEYAYWKDSDPKRVSECVCVREREKRARHEESECMGTERPKLESECMGDSGRRCPE